MESKEKNTLKIDLSHRVCDLENNNLMSATINNIDLVTGKLMAKLEILTDAIRSDSFGDTNNFLQSYIYGLIDDVDDIKAISSAYTEAVKGGAA